MVWRAMKEPKSPFSGAFFDTLFLSRNRRHALMTSEVSEAQTPLENVKSGLRKKKKRIRVALFWGSSGQYSVIFRKFPQNTAIFITFAVSVRTDLILRWAGRGAPTHYRYVLGAFWAVLFELFVSRAEYYGKRMCEHRPQIVARTFATFRWKFTKIKNSSNYGSK